MTNVAQNSSRLEQLAKPNNIFTLALSFVSKAESSDKNLTDIFMNRSG